MSTIQGPGRNALDPRLNRHEETTTPKDDKPVFRRDADAPSREPVRPWAGPGTDPAAARRDGVPGPAPSRHEARNQVVGAGYAVRQAAARTEGVVRQLVGHHHGGLFNPTGRRVPEDMPADRPIRIVHGSPSMFRASSLPGPQGPSPVPAPAPALPITPPAVAALPQVVPGTSRPVTSRLEAVEMVRTPSVDPS